MPSSKSQQTARRKSVASGQISEQKVAALYEQEGFAILECNWRAGHKEIDLIVRKGDLLVFVEVKSGRSKKFGHPAEKVTQKKISNLVEAASRYVADRDITGCDFRFDVVTLTNGEIEFFPGAFSVE